MKNTAFVLLLSSSLIASAADEPVGSPVNPMDHMVMRGEQLAQGVYSDSEVKQAFGDLMQAHLTFLNVTFRSVANKLTLEEKALAQMALRLLSDIVTDPIVREVISRGDVNNISESERAYLNAKLQPLEAFAVIAPALGKLLEENVMVTTTIESEGCTYTQTNPKPEYIASFLLLALDQIAQVLKDAQSAVQQ